MPVNPVTGRNMAPMTEVFGGARATPAAIFNKSRIENANSTATPRPNDLAMACPRCRNTGVVGSRLFAVQGVGYVCSVDGRHKWLDYDELMGENPEKLAYKGIVAKQDGWEKLTIEMPGSVLKDLQTKFGEKLQATIRSVMDVLNQARCMIVPEEDIKRLEERLGVELKNSNVLAGAVYSLKQTNQSLEEQNKMLLKVRPGARAMSATTLPIELGDLADTIIQKAAEWNMEPSEVVSDVMRKHIENGWL